MGTSDSVNALIIPRILCAAREARASTDGDTQMANAGVVPQTGCSTRTRSGGAGGGGRSAAAALSLSEQYRQQMRELMFDDTETLSGYHYQSLAALNQSSSHPSRVRRIAQACHSIIGRQLERGKTPISNKRTFLVCFRRHP